jgi:hypothetical protein
MMRIPYLIQGIELACNANIRQLAQLCVAEYWRVRAARFEANNTSGEISLAAPDLL